MGRGMIRTNARRITAASAMLLATGCMGLESGNRSSAGKEPALLPVATNSSAPQAPAMAVEAPEWQVGDRWRYNDGYGMRVEAVDSGLVTFRRLDDATQWVKRRGFLRETAQSATTLRQVIYRSIPADAGQRLNAASPLVFTREYTANKRMLVHNTSWVVEGREKVTVPAGSFDSYIIVMRTRNAATGWTGFERWWYAPEVRNYVRMEYRYGQQPIGSRVLVSFEPGGAQLSKAAATDVTATASGIPASQ